MHSGIRYLPRFVVQSNETMFIRAVARQKQQNGTRWRSAVHYNLEVLYLGREMKHTPRGGDAGDRPMSYR
jgi:hypothetical protein